MSSHAFILASFAAVYITLVQVRSTWELLTSDFNPLELCSKLDPLLTSISALSSPMSAASPVKDLHMDQYTTPLKQVRCAGASHRAQEDR